MRTFARNGRLQVNQFEVIRTIPHETPVYNRCIFKAATKSRSHNDQLDIYTARQTLKDDMDNSNKNTAR